MKEQSEKTQRLGAVGSSAVLDHCGMMGVRPYEVTIWTKDGSGPPPGWDESQCNQHRLAITGSGAVPMTYRLSTSDQLRCLATEVHQDSQPLKTFLLRHWFCALERFETQQSSRQGQRLSMPIWLKLYSWAIYALWSNEKAELRRDEKRGGTNAK